MTVTAAEAVLALLAGAILLALARLIRGPSLPDRVVALDLMANTGVAMMAVDTVLSGQMATLDAGIVVALVAFLGTVAFAHYLERGGGR
jgi:multicomponent Na+:H+ antiporter subunit F